MKTSEFSYKLKGKDRLLNLVDGSDWSQLQEVCDKIADATGEIFTFTTRDLRGGEILYQYDDVPSQIANFIEQKDKIPVMRETEPSKPISPIQTKIPLTAAQATAEVEAESSKLHP